MSICVISVSIWRGAMCIGEYIISGISPGAYLISGPYHRKAVIDFNRPGKPTDNWCVESFNGSLRDECLNVHWVEAIDDARAKIEAWRVDY